MNKEKQRIAIAEACDFSEVRVDDMEHVDIDAREVSIWKQLNGTRKGIRFPVPDYPNDLNAMHEAEKVLTDHPTNKPWSSDALDCADSRYIHHLVHITGATLMNHEGLTTYARLEELKLIQAPAAQRAEAFLRALNLWEESS